MTSTPVLSSNGLTICSVSLTGLGPLFMTQRRTLPLTFLAASVDEDLLADLDGSSSPPHAAKANVAKPRATAAATMENLLTAPLLQPGTCDGCWPSSRARSARREVRSRPGWARRRRCGAPASRP